VLDPLTFATLELDGRMLHVEVIGETSTHLVKHPSAISARSHHDMRGNDIDARLN
jgi:hypothetical protein